MIINQFLFILSTIFVECFAQPEFDSNENDTPYSRPRHRYPEDAADYIIPCVKNCIRLVEKRSAKYHMSSRRLLGQRLNYWCQDYCDKEYSQNESEENDVENGKRGRSYYADDTPMTSRKYNCEIQCLANKKKLKPAMRRRVCQQDCYYAK